MGDLGLAYNRVRPIGGPFLFITGLICVFDIRPSIETTLGEFPVSARVLALMPATTPMFPTLGS